MADPGCVERNVLQHHIALQRASARNGGEHVPTTPPDSVTGVTFVPSRAVDKPVPNVHDDGGEQ